MRRFFTRLWAWVFFGKTSLQSIDIRAHIHTVSARRFSTKLNVALRTNMAVKEIAVVFVILSSISPSHSDNDDFTHRCGFRRQGVRLFHAFCNVLWKVESYPDLMRPTTHLKGLCTGANLILKIVILSFRFRSWKQNHTIWICKSCIKLAPT